jgi:NTP pyrophosphatase (non-canonical NTP hydrolase)
MRSRDYIKLAMRSENRDHLGITQRLFSPATQRLLHSFMGLSTEANELLNALKAHIFYGKELDKVNVEEELGDSLWFIAQACDELGFSFEKIMEKNIAKLRARYPEKFTESNAVSRDLDNERKVLENYGASRK